jgi:hypothetical protein
MSAPHTWEIIRMKKETQRVCEAFLRKETLAATRSSTKAGMLFLHYNEIARLGTCDGKEHVGFNMCGWPSPITLDRLNGVCKLLWGRNMFFKRKGRVYFGPTNLREVDPKETLFIPLDYKPGEEDGHRRVPETTGGTSLHG